MAIDKQLYREVFAQYRRWNDAELKAKAADVQERSAAELWQQYESLWQFCVALAGPPSEMYLRRNMQEWAEYYQKVQKFEAWKRKHAG